MTPSEDCYKIIEEFEGCVLKAYRCPAGVPTIGYGHTLGVQMGDTCTHEQAVEWLHDDIADAADAVNAQVKVPMSQSQFDALVSFTFNLGAHNLEVSTLLKLMNKGDIIGAADEFPKWDRAGGQVLAGLDRRRHAERDLFLA